MTKTHYSKKKSGDAPISDQTVAEAMKLAKANQAPGQSKEQTKLVAKGIEKGIAQYKKQQKAKQRELDKQRKKISNNEVVETVEVEILKQSKLAWWLLLVSWVGFAGLWFLVK